MQPSEAVLTKVASTWVGMPVKVRYADELYNDGRIRHLGEASWPASGRLIRLVNDMDYGELCEVFAHEVGHHVSAHPAPANRMSAFSSTKQFRAAQANMESISEKQRDVIRRYDGFENEAIAWAKENVRHISHHVARTMLEEASGEQKNIRELKRWTLQGQARKHYRISSRRPNNFARS